MNNLNQTDHYANLEIRILKEEEGGYPVELTVNNEQEYEAGQLDAVALPEIAATDDGEAVFSWLFASDEFKTTWAEIRGQYPQRRIRLRLDDDAPELHTIRWELLRDNSGSTPQDLAATVATPFSRYLAGKWQPGTPIYRRPIKILVAMANPSNLQETYDLAQLNVDEEWAALQAITTDLGVELTQLPQPCTLQALEAELKNGHHILHFIGHGQFSKRNNASQLMMANEDNQVELVSEDEFAAMLARQLSDVDVRREDKLRLVFLASCQTATRSPADAFRGLAPALINAGVPAVMAMQDLIPVETAQDFSKTFYQQFLDHGQVDLACNEARSALLSAELPGATTPVLFMRLRSGQLLGQRGQIISSQADTFWPFLLENIRSSKCMPILGPRINEGLLPSRSEVSQRLAEKYHYPMADIDDLARVAQFVGLKDRDLLQSDYLRLLQRSVFRYLNLKPTQEDRQKYGDASLSATTLGIDWADKVIKARESVVQHQLAEIGFPLYLTTNADNFIEQAIRYQGIEPIRGGPRWQQQGEEVKFVLYEDETEQVPLEPSLEKPLVFHLNGYDEDSHLILSEDDYLNHLIRLAHPDEQESMLPMQILSALSQQSFMFLGFGTEDWEFRVILQGLLRPLARTGVKRHVGVQLELDQADQVDRIVAYLQEYLEQFKIEIYWGTAQQFAGELHSLWQESTAEGDLAEDDDGWDEW